MSNRNRGHPTVNTPPARDCTCSKERAKTHSANQTIQLQLLSPEQHSNTAALLSSGASNHTTHRMAQHQKRFAGVASRALSGHVPVWRPSHVKTHDKSVFRRLGPGDVRLSEMEWNSIELQGNDSGERPSPNPSEHPLPTPHTGPKGCAGGAKARRHRVDETYKFEHLLYLFRAILRTCGSFNNST